MEAERIYEEIDRAAQKSGRSASDITLVAVSKKQTIGKIQEYHEYCVRNQFTTILGENYIQELKEKRTALPSGVRVHFIGHLQSNKVKDAASLADCIESVDSTSLAEKLNSICEREGKVLPVLLQVNISKDPAKSGVMPDDAEGAYEKILTYTALKATGLMAITQVYDHPEHARPDFQRMKMLAEKIQGRLGTVPLELSMGMSDDFVYAIEEGATTVRIGSALFGSRSS